MAGQGRSGWRRAGRLLLGLQGGTEICGSHGDIMATVAGPGGCLAPRTQTHGPQANLQHEPSCMRRPTPGACWVAATSGMRSPRRYVASPEAGIWHPGLNGGLRQQSWAVPLTASAVLLVSSERKAVRRCGSGTCFDQGHHPHLVEQLGCTRMDVPGPGFSSVAVPPRRGAGPAGGCGV